LRSSSGAVRLYATPYKTVASSTKPMPSMPALPEPTAGASTATTPARPTTRPVSGPRPGMRRDHSAAIAAVNSGAAPLIVPASADGIDRSASGNNTNGPAIHTRPSRATGARSARRSGLRAAGKQESRATPNSSRSQATVAGAKLCTPALISRNDEPHITATAASRAQSRAAKPAGALVRESAMPLPCSR